MDRLITVILSLLLTLACDQDPFSNIDIEAVASEWSIIDISISGENFPPEKKEHPKDDAYTIKLEIDSTFTLVTNVNDYFGEFQINPEGMNISFQILGGSRIGTIDQYAHMVNDSLLASLAKVITYNIEQNNLTLIAENGNIKLTKK